MASILQLAGMLPRDPQFREWVAQWMVPPREVDVDTAAEFIRTVCEIESRKQLATDRAAEQRFHQFLRRPFVAWRDSQQHQRRAA
ncbi:hypothetical protein [Burkholderia cenocepacia]|uniref:hypothetical protein n=1 Tax=Burkholderia cenocepacia TaxID=95486 RepID=UPI0020190AB0|nr:hypothetical protein [Burkholderia cenocepacia]MCO1396401.1 hypothetical protein [Burkholderia cenocepacia]MCO1408975.1 hypothetical protein [Burkholderia cenocepacia]UQN92050.1 hypothetical protein L0Z06_15120 [Burkholderia cenocepacia]UQN99199.1 hypothetical protein L0Z39_16910 [Burkholderia cenocepacia]UQP50846.1 hypothetical protein L0Y99_10335 [Burkholderia cenocepacia]